VTLSEAARRIDGVTYGVLNMARRRKDVEGRDARDHPTFPAPKVESLEGPRAVRLYDLADLEKWWRDRP